MLRIHRIGGIRRFPSGGTAHCYATFSLFLLTIWGGRTEGVWYDNYRRGESPVFEIILWEVSLKNKRGRLFFKRLFVPQASQSSHDRRAEPDVLLAVPPARSACGMGGCLLYTSPSPRDGLLSRMPSSA